MIPSRGLRANRCRAADPTRLHAHRTAASLAVKKGGERQLGRSKGGLTPKLHAIADERGRPLIMALTPGRMYDVKRADLTLPIAPRAKALIASAHGRRREMEICIPSKKQRKVRIPHHAGLYRQRSRIEVMFGRIKDGRRIATRYDRCGALCFAATTIAAIVSFWL